MCARKVIMKKTLMICCIVLVAVLACSVFVACNPTEDPGQDNNGHNQYEQAKYTVTFNVNSPDFKLTNNVIRDVLAGTSVDKPKNADGTEITPIKTGYTFKYWSADGTNEFIFGQTPIVKNTTLTAIYTNNTYELTPHLDKKVVATKGENGEYTYSLEKCATGATLASGTKLVVTYNSKNENLDCPTAAESDEFMFWFYFDKDNKPVRLTKFATSSSAVVQTENTWLLTKSVDVYAMFKSTLPKAEVRYVDSLSEDVYYTASYPVTDSIAQTEADDIVKNHLSKAGYKFAKWFYKQSIAENDEEKTIDKDFVFKTDNATGTTLYTACGLKDYFTPATIKMYAKWTKQISIASVDDFRFYHDLLRKENPTEQEQQDINELLESDIKLSSIDFGTNAFEPLFDENHVFVGTIDGATYDENQQVTARAKIIGGVFGNSKHASVFGYVSGSVANVAFENVNLKIEKNAEGKYENTVNIGFVASVLGGKIENCSVKSAAQVFGEKLDGQDWTANGMKAVCFGGIAARAEGNNAVKDTGMIRDCTVEAEASFACESLIFGGICGVGNSSCALSSNTVNVTLSDVYCSDDSQSSNGRSFAKIGGIAATNGGQISKSDVTIAVTKLTSLDEAYFGGVCADNSGSVITTKSSATLDATVGGAISQIVCIGGIIGRNEGYVYNSHCAVDIKVVAKKANGIVALGGIIGSNFSDKTDSGSSSTSGIGAINSTYATGSVSVEATADNIELYVGGIAGRNSQSKIANCFVATDITVKNTQSGKNNIGRTFGKHEKKASFSTATIHYAIDKAFTLNGSGEFEYTQNMQGNYRAGADFKSDTFLKDKNLILFDGEVWNIVDGQYPTLK